MPATSTTFPVSFAGFACLAIFARYAQGGRVCIRLVDAEDGSPVATATVNPELPGLLERGEVAVKDWSENAGMVDALVAAGLVERPHDEMAMGFVSAPICKLTRPALEAAGWREGLGWPE